MEMTIIPNISNVLSYDDLIKTANAGKIYISNTLNIYLVIFNERDCISLLYLSSCASPKIMKDEDMRGKTTFTLFTGTLTLTNTKD